MMRNETVLGYTHRAQHLMSVDQVRTVEQFYASLRDESGRQRDQRLMRSGKYVVHQGRLDPSVAANYSIDYLQKVRVELGAERADSMMRLHLVPGMLHCRGGSGVDHFGGSGDTQAIGDARHDVLSALVQWVEQGQVPKDINDSRIESGRVMRQRPLCPYPQQAAHRGGDINQADSCARAVVDEESQLR